MNLKALAVLVAGSIPLCAVVRMEPGARAGHRAACAGAAARAVAIAGAMALAAGAYAVAIVRVERYWHDDVTFFSRCVAIAPHNAEYLRRIWWMMLNQKGDFTAAMNVLRDAVNRDPDNFYLHLKLADQYAMMQRRPDFQCRNLKDAGALLGQRASRGQCGASGTVATMNRTRRSRRQTMKLAARAVLGPEPAPGRDSRRDPDRDHRVYLPSLRNGWVFDDREEFVDNKLIHSWSFLWNSFIYDSWWFKDPQHLPQSAYYRPLEDVWFAANALVFGKHPAAWHLAKIVAAPVAVVLCFRVAQLLTGDVEPGC